MYQISQITHNQGIIFLVFYFRYIHLYQYDTNCCAILIQFIYLINQITENGYMNKMIGKILIVDDDPDVLTTARLSLKNDFSDIILENNPENIPVILAKELIDVVILDMNFSPGITDGEEGLYWLQKIKKIDAEISVIMNTAYGDIKIAVAAMKLGASEFIVKPWESEKLLATVKTVFDLSKTKKQLKKLKITNQILNEDFNREYGSLITKAESMQTVLSAINKVARTDANVLILGENGTGKELVAREIHQKSERAEKPFIKVDLGAISESLFESELFGHTKGAFTDAKEDKPGRFEIASGGTLFLDEIGNLSLNLQSKLLSVIQNRVINRVGSNRNIDIDIRLICATNKDLYALCEHGEFREDLIYRINTVEIHVPALRNREKDILFLASVFRDRFCHKYNKQRLNFSPKAEKALLNYNWPGNIRELQHVIERAVIMSDEKIIEEHVLALKKSAYIKPVNTLKIDELEKQAILKALEKHNRNFTKVSAELGFGRSTLYRKMKKYGI